MTTLTNFNFFKLLTQHIEFRKPQKQLPIKTRRELHRDYEKLAELPDYLLADMGITRSELKEKRLNTQLWH